MQKEFWADIELLKKAAGKKDRPITSQELEILRNKIESLFGTRPSDSFVRVCAHVRTPTLKSIVQALDDLRISQWTYERAIVNKSDKISVQSSAVFDVRNGGPQYGTRTVARYPRTIDPMKVETEMRGFLTENFNQLSPAQREMLRSFRPAGFAAHDYR
jgi:hypothetical protein